MSQKPDSTEHLLKPDPVFILLERLFLLGFVLFAAIMIVKPLGHPIELWDESRNANNAVEMVMRGHWLTPTYNWTVDNWNTKPPLLIWIIAGLERLGLPPLVALRLPSAIFALSTVIVLFLFGRTILRRPFVGLAAALLLMSSLCFFGPHVAMSGDYDALLCLCTTLYTLGFFCFAEGIEPFATMGIAVAGVALCGAVLTKGIGGVLILPGLLVYAIVRGRLRAVLSDRRLWFALCGVALVAALYYEGRNIVAPGYIHAVWDNELAGRYGQANEGHHGRTLMYGHYLLQSSPAIMTFGILGLFSLKRRALKADAPQEQQTIANRSRAAAIFSGVVSLIFLLILTKSKTKIFYYCAPALPLIAIFAAIGIADTLERLAPRLSWSAALPKLQIAAFAILGLLVCYTTPKTLREGAGNTAGVAAYYGSALADLAKTRNARGDHSAVILIDPGFDAVPLFYGYDPVADYDAKEASRHGMPTTRALGVPPHAPGTWLVSCDPATQRLLTTSHVLADTIASPHDCLYGQAAQ